MSGLLQMLQQQQAPQPMRAPSNVQDPRFQQLQQLLNRPGQQQALPAAQMPSLDALKALWQHYGTQGQPAAAAPTPGNYSAHWAGGLQALPGYNDGVYRPGAAESQRIMQMIQQQPGRMAPQQPPGLQRLPPLSAPPASGGNLNPSSIRVDFHAPPEPE